MSKICPKCGKELPDDAKFCMDCGYTLEDEKSEGMLSSFPLPALFIIVIVAILVIGGAFILSSSFKDNTKAPDKSDEVTHAVDLTITDVRGWDSDSGKKSYTLYTEAIFNKVPDNLKGYNVKTTYYDTNGSEIGHETQTLDDVYYDSNYALSFGFYTTYKLPNPDHVTVEIINGGKVIDSYTEHIDKNKIDYLN
ncbi:zinc ribbon domain-containing protein [Methanobrevibacter sp. UBA212]|uniref:zinc ribbon domain-containing protein n=1 Tax=Methanobrevibacter sp. UBA212 TaxID=1915476 RepID=UPI0025E82F36|nr:zinc ribbon domain-containing protein [Methanobrevibacter sp. UBA212]MEE1149906.1 zinc ribbon domain-containing protein [Methanobrevibacter sp.]